MFYQGNISVDRQRPGMSAPVKNCPLRWALLTLGWVSVGVGLVGVIVPGLPTTVFLIVALWAFSRSSEKFQLWLWNHPRLGPPLRAWHDYRVIPVGAKILATTMMAGSFFFVAFFVAESWVLPGVMAAVMVPVAAYLLSRASTVPQGGRFTPPIGPHDQSSYL